MAHSIKTKPSAALAQARTFVKNQNPARPVDALVYTDELWRLDTKVGLNPVVLLAQSAYETGIPGRGYWQSPFWRDELNPAGIGIGDVSLDRMVYTTGKQAADAHTTHMAGYVQGNTGWLTNTIYKRLDPRWDDLMASGMAGKVATVEQLGNGYWSTQDTLTYAGNIIAIMDKIEATIAPLPPKLGPTDTGNAPETADSILTQMSIIWEGTNNYHGRSGQTPMFLFHHITDDEYYPNTKNWFQNPNSDASSTFVITEDGRIHQFVSTLNAPWTNGDIQNPRRDIPRLNDALNVGVNFNNFCVTIEYVGKPYKPITDAQFKSGQLIAKYCNAVYGIPFDRNGQMRHSDVNSVTRYYCPNGALDLERFIKELGGNPEKLS